ncbi:cytidine deaminase-like protein [Mycena latifolia]|nr:cytidine deaminase-like protein [Mycena latifolia]
MATHVWTMSVEQRESLIKAAFEAKQYTYSPYSKFPVGAALLAADGTIYKGANIENASYGGTICAERTAIVKAVSDGTKSFIALAVVTDVPSSLSPCGMCRQVIREFCAADMPILLVPGDYPKPPGDESEGKPGFTAGGVKETSIGELLPDSFGPEHLELPRTGGGKGQSLTERFDWMSEMDAIAPPAYDDDEFPPPYQQPSRIRAPRRTAVFYPEIPLQDTFRFDESSRQQELQLLLGVLLSIVVTLFLMDVLPVLGQPTSSIHAIRIYGCFAMALLLSILLATVSLLCRYWLTRNHLKLLQFGPQGSGAAPKTKFQAVNKYALNALIASGLFMTYSMFICFGVGLVDFFWQLYPALGAGIVATCGIYGSGPLLSYFGQGPLFKCPMASAVRYSCQFARTWTARGSTGSSAREEEIVAE